MIQNKKILTAPVSVWKWEGEMKKIGWLLTQAACFIIWIGFQVVRIFVYIKFKLRGK